MNAMVRKSLLAILAAGGLAQGYAAEPNPAAQALSPTEVEEAGEKEQRITFIQDDAQDNFVSKVYELKHTVAADLAPFVKSAVIRFNEGSSVSSLEDLENKRQLLIVSTTTDMMPYVDEMVEKLDRKSKIDAYGTGVAGTGIAYGTYKPKFRASKDMRKVIVGGEVSSGSLDSKVRLDSATNMFYFKDTPYRVKDIKDKLAWLDKPIPQARIELTVYEVRDSDLKDIGIDYLAWKNGPGLNLFEAGYEALSVQAAETIFNELTQRGLDLFGNFSYGFGGMYTAPAFDFSFIRILEQNGKATVNSTASVMVSNVADKVFAVSFSPEYQNILKDEDHRSSVDVGGSAELSLSISSATITGAKDGVVNFDYTLVGSNVVERNNMGVEISETTETTSSVTLAFNSEKLLMNWTLSSDVEQTIGVPFLCELPILKYIFGTTTNNTEITHYFIVAKAVPVAINNAMQPGEMAEFTELVKR